MRRAASHGIAFGAALLALACALPSGGGSWRHFEGVDDSELNWGVCPDAFPPGCQLALLSRDPETGAVDLYLRVPGGTALPPHAHSADARMLGVAGRWQLESGAHRTLELASGGYAREPAGTTHAPRCVGDAPCVLFLALDAPFDVVAQPPAGS